MYHTIGDRSSIGLQVLGCGSWYCAKINMCCEYPPMLQLVREILLDMHGCGSLLVLQIEACSILTLDEIRHSWIFTTRERLTAVHEQHQKTAYEWYWPVQGCGSLDVPICACTASIQPRMREQPLDNQLISRCDYSVCEKSKDCMQTMHFTSMAVDP